MKKALTTVFLIILAAFLSACSGENPMVSYRINLLNRQTEKELAEAYLVQIFNAIAVGDKDGIESAFSPYAQEHADRLDDSIEYLFTYVDGALESWETVGGTVDSSKSGGEITVEYTYRFYAHTTSGSYLVAITGFTKNSLSPQHIGLYSLVIYNTPDLLEKEPAFWGPGIYMPKGY